MTFKELHLSEMLIKGLERKGYTNPTEIQIKAIPAILQRRDVFASAQTGTGKTAAFTLPLLQLMSAESEVVTSTRRLRALILTPTRELAIQIADNLAQYKQYLKIRHTVIYGGVSQHTQVMSLKSGTDILIATPGRLKDLIEQGFINLSNVGYFILDEADRMLDSGFLADVKRIVRLLPQQRQTLLFSATIPAEIEKLAGSLLKNPVRVEVQPVSSTVDTISQQVYYVDKHLKQNLLHHLLESENMNRVLVFTTMKHHADKISQRLMKSGIKAEAIHGNKSQSQRQKALDKFKSNQLRVLVATDVVARGIDIDNLSHVINYELPDVAETYVHRIGRTGRKGRSGHAISFCSREERPQLNDIQKLIEVKIPVAADFKTEAITLN